MDKTDVTALIDVIENELSAIANKGINASNFDMCYRLVDMRYKLDMIKYSTSVKTTCYNDYMNAKRIYKHSHTSTNQENVIDALEIYMSKLTDSIENMVNDCDCDKEKQIIMNYLSKI